MALKDVSKLTNAYLYGGAPTVPTATTVKPAVAAPKPVAAPAVSTLPKPAPAPAVNPTLAAPAPAPKPVAAAPKPVALRYDPKNEKEKALINAGYNQGFGGGGADQWLTNAQNAAKYQIELEKLTSPAASETGVVPVGLIEPLNDWQKAPLATQASLAPTAADFGQVKSIFQQAYEKAMSDADPNQNAALKGNIEAIRNEGLETRNRLNPTLNANAAQAGAFGGTRDAVQRALADEMIGNNINTNIAGLMNDNYWKGLSSNLQQASTLSGLGQQQLGIYDYLMKGALSAGDRVQSENQKLTDVTRAEEMAKLGYDQDTISWYMNLLNSIKSPIVGQTPQGVGALQGAIGGGLAGYGLYNSLSGTQYNPITSSTAPLPWKQ